MKIIYFIFVSLILQSCAKDYSKELEKFKMDLSQKGDSVIAFSTKKHFALFQKQREGLYLYDFKTKTEKALFLPNTNIIRKTYTFDYTGEISESTSDYPIQLVGQLDFCYLMTDENAIILHLNGRPNNGYLLYNLSSIDSVFELGNDKPQIIDGLVCCQASGTVIEDSWPEYAEDCLSDYTKYSLVRSGLTMVMPVWLDSTGKKAKEGTTVRCAYYDVEVNRSLFGNQQEIREFYIKVNDAFLAENPVLQKEEKKKREIVAFLKRKITTAQNIAGAAKSNPLRFDKLFKGSYMLIEGEIEEINESQGDEYSIKLSHPEVYYTAVKCYTNDEIVLELYNGTKVYILGVLDECDNNFGILYIRYKSCKVFTNLDDLAELMSENAEYSHLDIAMVAFDK